MPELVLLKALIDGVRLLNSNTVYGFVIHVVWQDSVAQFIDLEQGLFNIILSLLDELNNSSQIPSGEDLLFYNREAKEAKELRNHHTDSRVCTHALS